MLYYYNINNDYSWYNICSAQVLDIRISTTCNSYHSWTSFHFKSCEIDILLSTSFTYYPCHWTQGNLKVLLHYNCLIIIYNIVTIIFKALKILCNLILGNQLSCRIWYYKKYHFQIFKPLWLSYARLQPLQVYCTTEQCFSQCFITISASQLTTSLDFR